MALWAAGPSGAVEPPALLTLDTACVYLKGGLCGVWRTSREEERGARGVKRRKTGGGGRARGEFGEVINIQQLLRRSYYPATPPPPPPPPLLCVLSMPESRWNVRAQGGGSSLVLSN